MMKDLYPSKLQQAVNALLTRSATTPPKLRQAAKAYAAKLGGATSEPAEVPADLEPYLKKVALYAYKTTDADVGRLHEAGYSEDQIFELTLSAALGAGLVRLERGLAALEGEPHALENS